MNYRDYAVSTLMFHFGLNQKQARMVKYEGKTPDEVKDVAPKPEKTNKKENKEKEAD